MSFSITENKIILWRISDESIVRKKDLYDKHQLNRYFSGIAQIQFEGDKGLSQPIAELGWL